jgi:hypothetical protein
MIEYVEIRAAETRDIIGIVDAATSIIWRSSFYETGDFEIYAPCNSLNVGLLVEGNYISRPGVREIGIIERVDVSFDPYNGRMIAASGRMAKSILDRRIIYKLNGYSVSPIILTGNVESAARSVVKKNAIDCSFDSRRNIPILKLGVHSGSTKIIIDESGNAGTKQTTYDNLLQFTNDFLHEYEIGAFVGLDSNKKLEYYCREGVDRSVDNTEGNEPVIFSQEYDNLNSSEYIYDETTFRNVALIGGEGEGTARFCTVYNPNKSGIARRELFVDASQSSKTYIDDDGNEQTISNSDYNKQLKAIGRQEIANMPIVQSFDGEINISSGSYVYGVNYELGDIITVQDNAIGLYINTRIIEITEVQDEKGYNITAKYGV